MKTNPPPKTVVTSKSEPDCFADQRIPKFNIGDPVVHGSSKCRISDRLLTKTRGWVYGILYYPSGGGGFWWDESEIKPATDPKHILGVKKMAAANRIEVRNFENKADQQIVDSLQLAINNL